MIYTVTLNPCLDYVIRLENLQPGQINKMQTEQLFPGGKGNNVAMVLTNLGQSCTALGFRAGDTGKMMTEMLQKHGCKTDFVSLEKGNTRINVKIHAKEETQINGQGPEASKEEMEQLLQKISLLKKEDVLVLAGSVPGSCPTDIYELFFEALQEKNVKVVVDTTGEALLKVLPYHPFLIKPNVEELGELFHIDLSCEEKEELINYGRKLQQMGAKNVLISRDKKGAVLIAEEGICYEKQPPQGEVVNSVGAGDSMVAGFLTGYLNTKDYEKALELAVVTGSATAFRAWLAEKEDVEKFLIRQPREYGL